MAISQQHEISEYMLVSHPNNCPVIERTADGERVGVCWFHLKDGVCPRHGKVKPQEAAFDRRREQRC
jgi:hypothetical protein